MVRCFIAFGVLLAAPVQAGIDYPPVQIDMSNLATISYVTNAITSGTPAQCSTPLADTLNGSAGTGTCMASPTATRPTAVQGGNAALDAACNWSVSFGRAMVSSSPIVNASIVQAGATLPTPCIVTARSTTAASGKCFPGQTVALNLSIITAGINLSPFGATCTAGTPVMVAWRDPTQ